MKHQMSHIEKDELIRELIDTLLHLKHNRHHTIEEEIWKIDEILKKVQNA